MRLYHYTSLKLFQSILDDRVIKLTASNLLKPINPHIVNRCFIDETDIYKPVVWASSLIDFDEAEKMGIPKFKTEVAIEIDSASIQFFHKWSEWAEENNIDQMWFNALKITAPQWETFYVSEKPIVIDDHTKIKLRSDIYDLLNLEK